MYRGFSIALFDYQRVCGLKCMHSQSLLNRLTQIDPYQHQLSQPPWRIRPIQHGQESGQVTQVPIREIDRFFEALDHCEAHQHRLLCKDSAGFFLGSFCECREYIVNM